jgi:hypothetical protein
VEQPTSVVRRSKRVIKLVEMYIPPKFCSTFVLSVTDDEPKMAREEFDSVERKIWKDSMVEEMESLIKNETWDLFKLPSGINPSGRK